MERELERIHFCFGKIVIPAKAGIQPNGVHTVSLVPGFRRDDRGASRPILNVLYEPHLFTNRRCVL
ncbi:MAG: hypothetical protein FWG73_00835 [Planctomycetaceae bacterium]|nr:hypothetical protein [Planctomycetaceae bacterium]